MGSLGIDIKRDNTGNVTCEIITQNPACRQSLKALTEQKIKDHISFVTDEGIKFLIGFHDKEALNASKSDLYGVLNNFSNDVDATFYNAS